jgi:hypothetical protein
MTTETPDPNRPTPRSPDGNGDDRKDLQRDPRAPEDRPGEERRRPPDVLPEEEGDEDDLGQEGQSGNKDRERSGDTRTRKP